MKTSRLEKLLRESEETESGKPTLITKTAWALKNRVMVASVLGSQQSVDRLLDAAGVPRGRLRYRYDMVFNA